MSDDRTTHASNGAPAQEYAARLGRRSERARKLALLERRISNSRLLVFIAGVAIAWAAIDARAMSPWWIAAPFLLFVALLFVHDRVIRQRRRADRAVKLYEAGVARLEDRWSGGGSRGDDLLDEHHPYAADLDLFGRGSLFERLCAARTQGGEATLARWLCAPAEPEAIRARQAAVEELRPLLDLREELALVGAEVRAQLDPEALEAWAAAPAELASPRLRIAAALLAAATAATATAAALGSSLLPLLAALVLEGVFALSLRRRVLGVIRAVERPGRDLALLAAMLAVLEREQFAAARLIELRAALDTDGLPPSRQIDLLRRRVDRLDSRRNQLFAPIAALLMWATQCAMSIDAWQARCGGAVGRWLAAVAEVEALASLAGYAYERPEDPFPEIAEQGPVFAGEGIGHPLLPASRCVRNDVELDTHLQVLIVSGSNMSGKSTLLRAVGTNTVLALAGAPVRARRLRLSPLAVGASIRLHDSLQEGTSRFYAEIKRLRQIVDLTAGGLPLLFLLDEIFHGTNSHDRRVGAEAIIRNLLDRGAIGLVTTHDLALARIAEALAPRIANVHFADHLEDGRITFDYRMRPGVVGHSNALALMRAVGLEV